jgi:hypothetical protein
MREEMETIGERIAEWSTRIDVAMHQVLTDIRAFDAGGGWYQQGAMSCAHWLSWRIGWTLGTARDRVRVAQRLGELPLIDAALGKGEISYSKVRAMTRVATPANEELLLTYARHSTAAQLETICRKYQTVQRINAPDREREAAYRQVSRRELEDGMIKVEAVLRPDEAAILWVAIEQATRDVSGKTRAKADGLMAIAQGYARGESPDRTPVEIVVTVPQPSLAGSSDDPAAVGDGSFVSAETSRRLACDAGVVEIVEGPDGEVLSVGRKTRTIPTAIKRALLHRDAHTCRFPGCSNRAYIDGHHIEHWANGGETSLENLVSVCSYHHGFLHEHGYRVELDAGGAATFYDPRGRRVEVVPEPWRIKRAWEGCDLDVSAETGRSLWDGRVPDYSLAIDGLLAADS